MSAVRFASAAINSWLASFAVLRFGPAATMPPLLQNTLDPATPSAKMLYIDPRITGISPFETFRALRDSMRRSTGSPGCEPLHYIKAAPWKR
jgi:hypothetical protein